LIFSWAEAVPESNRLPRATNPTPPLNIAFLPLLADRSRCRLRLSLASGYC
jgi:hypothetical protein